MIAKVITDLSLDRVFDYQIPELIAAKIRPGSRVRVPFGNSSRLGFVLEIAEKSEYPALKELQLYEKDEVSIPENLLKLGDWIKDYYCASQEQAIRTLLPGAVRSGKVNSKKIKVYSVSSAEAAQDFIEKNQHKKTAAKRILCLNFLLENPESSAEDLADNCKTTPSVIKTLLDAELISFSEKIVRSDLFDGREAVRSEALTPNADQQKAIDLVENLFNSPEEKKRTILLFGVTNSGKTEVYLQAIAKALERGLDSIVLVPEISLTPQTVRRFRSRFGNDISVLHSRLSDRERFDEWMRIRNGEVKIAVGARSALFAPFKNPGLIIVDEEHESSYKQSEAPRYHARDVAVMRGFMENAVVILGSATPSAESFYNAQIGKYHLVPMRSKVDDKAKPLIRVVDQRLAALDNENRKNFFSPLLVNAVNDRLNRGEQVILFLNRRGYARVMNCELCGYEARCPNCAVSYTYSRRNETLSCHLCGEVVPAPTVCPNCQSPEIRYMGIGTEKIESAAISTFKNARIGRMDSDTMKNAEAYEKTLNSFKRGDIDILVGTQMIAKGLHFPNVTLVGIIHADHGLMMPDFRAPERTFQLITQVAGRAGRGDIRGEVMLQTYNPDNETIRFAAEDDYESFYKFDMSVREMLKYPPYGHLMTVHFKSENEMNCLQYAEFFKSELMPYIHSEVQISGPSPAPIERIKGKFRYMLIIRGEKLKVIREKIRYLLFRCPIPKNVEAYADIDAQSML